MKTKEELNALKEEIENLKGKLAELSEDELTLVIGGAESLYLVKCEKCSNVFYMAKNEYYRSDTVCPICRQIGGVVPYDEEARKNL